MDGAVSDFPNFDQEYSNSKWPQVTLFEKYLCSSPTSYKYILLKLLDIPEVLVEFQYPRFSTPMQGTRTVYVLQYAITEQSPTLTVCPAVVQLPLNFYSLLVKFEKL
jgi:hypothetical protein